MISGVWTGQNPSGWLMSEKFDGVRGHWDGAALWTREGNPIAAPDWWLASLPVGVRLDGEIWMGRGLFRKTMGACKRKVPLAEQWAKMRFCAFDLPLASGGYAERAAGLPAYANDVVLAVAQTVCRGTGHMRAELQRVFELGGEGIMLRKPAAGYEVGLSSALLKVRWENNSELIRFAA